MRIVSKDALYAGRYRLPDTRTFVCKPEDVKHYVGRAKAWLAAGLPIPVNWEHQKAELSAADKAKNTFSHLTDAVIGKGKNDKECLEIKFPAEDDADFAKLPKVKYVSPTIKWDVVDSTGKLWPGPSITEIALTPVPVQHDQKPFTLSQAGNEIAPIFLSLAEDAYDPVFLAEEPFKAPKEDEANDEEEETEDEEVDKTEPPEEEKKNAESLAIKLKAALEALADHGLILGGETQADFEQFLDKICVACKTKKASESPEPMDQDGKPKADGTGGEGVTEVQGPMMMSLYTENLKLRIANLWSTKRVTKDMRDKMLSDLSEVKLSVKGGKLTSTKLKVKVEAYEELPENYTAFRRNADLSQAKEVDPPPEAENRDVGSPERQKKAGSTLASMVNGKHA